MKYDAFISYSHAADGLLARALQTGLQRLAKPWYRRSILKIFRDQTSLAANPGLWSEIERNLAICRHFVLLASPGAAQSPWVERELVWWLTHRSADTLFVAVTDGTLRWDEATGDFDWTTTTCLPPSLKGRFSEEPLYVDLTWAKGKDDLSLRHSQFRGAVLDLAAPLHGRPKDELDSDDIRQHRRQRTVAWTAVCTIVVLALGAIVAAWAAVQNAAEAVRNAITATSRQYAVEAQLAIREGTLSTAVRSALIAWRTEDTAEARAAMFATLEAAWDIHAVLRSHRRPVRALVFLKEGAELLTWSDDGMLLAWDVPSRRPLRPPVHGMPVTTRAALFTPDGSSLITGMDNGTIIVWDAATLHERQRLTGEQDSAVTSLALDPTGRLLAAGYMFGGTTVIWDLQQAQRASIDLDYSDDIGHEFATTGLSFSADGRYLAAANQNPSASVGVWELPSGKPVARLNASNSFWTNERVAFVGDQEINYLAIGQSDGVVHLLREATGSADRFQELSSTSQHQGTVTSMAGGPGSLATGGSDGGVTMWSRLSDRAVVPASWSRPPVASQIFSSNGDYLAAGSDDGTVTIYHGRPSRPRSFDDVSGRLALPRLSSDGQWMVMPLPAAGLGLGPGRFAVRHVPSGRMLIEDTEAAITFSKDARWMIVSGAQEIAVWDLAGGKVQGPVLKRPGSAASLSPLGRFMVIEAPGDTPIRLIDLQQTPVAERILEGTGAARLAGFSPDDSRLLVRVESDLRLWDPARGRQVGRSIALEPLSEDDDDEDGYDFEFSADSRWFVVKRRSGTAALYPMDNTGSRGTSPVGKLATGAFSPDGKWLAVRQTGSPVVLWNLATMAPAIERAGTGWDVTVSANSRWALIRESVMRRAEVWDLQAGPSPVRTLGPFMAEDVLFSRDGRRLLHTEKSEGPLIIRELTSGDQRTLPVTLAGKHAFSTNGRLLAVDDVGEIALVDMESGTVSATLVGHSKSLHDLEFTPDDRILGSIDANGSMILWDVASRRRLGDTLAGLGEDEDSRHSLGFDADRGALGGIPALPLGWMAELCRRVDPALSRQEWTQLGGAVEYPWTCDSVRGMDAAAIASSPD